MTISQKLSEWSRRLADAQSAISQVQKFDAELRERYRTAKAARDRIANLPGPPQEVLENLRAIVSARARKWGEDEMNSLVRHLAPGLRTNLEGGVTQPRPSLPDNWVQLNLTLADVAALFPGLVLDRLKELVLSSAYEAGPPAADRNAALEKADREIAEAEAQHSQLVDAAAALTPPIALELLPEVKERRATEAVRARREADADARRREVESAADTAVRRQTWARSPYLEKG